MPAPDDLGQLNSADWQHLENLADSLEEAWKQGASVDIKKFLPPAGTPGRAIILLELIKTDLECRWRHGQSVTLEYYLEKFPDDLGSLHVLPSALIYEEYRVRHLHGDRPSLQQYKTRFPKQFPEVERLVEQQSSPTDETQAPSATPATPGGGTSQFAKNIVQTGGHDWIERIGRGGFAEVWKARAPGGILK
ncbi:MAG TPA: hypothetical protein VGX76_03275, partial [Pirellulales bacterium]|nr:hypothetical protein [Pirellulales bacterium]